jgi:hypothetical protein
MNATSRRVPLLYLIAAIMVVAGLSISAPPSCVCAPDEHFGLLLHPLFPHIHSDAHGGRIWQQKFEQDGDASVRTVEQSPGISAGSSDAGAHDVLTGLLLPLFLAGALLEVSRRLLQSAVRPEQRTLAPPSPPPRLALTLA